MIELLSFISFIIVFLYLFLAYMKLRIKYFSLVSDLLESNIKNSVMMQELLNIKEKEELDGESSDGFLKFVSQSRDWAFDYIETAQDGIKEFIDSVGSDIDYMDTYRPPIISEEVTDRLINSYRKLKELLPEIDK
jgi:hypothetical protein